MVWERPKAKGAKAPEQYTVQAQDLGYEFAGELTGGLKRNTVKNRGDRATERHNMAVYPGE